MSDNPFRASDHDRQHVAAELFELAGQVDRLHATAAWLEGDVEAPPQARSVAAALREVLQLALDLGHVELLQAAVAGYGGTFGGYCDEAAAQLQADQVDQAADKPAGEQGGGG